MILQLNLFAFPLPQSAALANKVELKTNLSEQPLPSSVPVDKNGIILKPEVPDLGPATVSSVPFTAEGVSATASEKGVEDPNKPQDIQTQAQIPEAPVLDSVTLNAEGGTSKATTDVTGLGDNASPQQNQGFSGSQSNEPVVVQNVNSIVATGSNQNTTGFEDKSLQLRGDPQDIPPTLSEIPQSLPDFGTDLHGTGPKTADGPNNAPEAISPNAQADGANSQETSIGDNNASTVSNDANGDQTNS
eukprot:NODE_763_length_4099_cov_0.613500.p2 type:complete len:246 gc:universal NODE_763_length_4099_cov_0.613500:3332-4069(+)